MLTFDKVCHKYYFNGKLLPSVTTILKDLGFIDLKFSSQNALERGSEVHLATELFDRNELDYDSVNWEIQGYLDAWVKFKNDYKFNPKKIEQPVCHLPLQYAGMVDRIGSVDGTDCIIDIKSGVPHPWHRLQLTAYLMAAQIPIYTKRLGVYLHQNGNYNVITFNYGDLNQDLNDWRTIASFYHVINKYNRLAA